MHILARNNADARHHLPLPPSYAHRPSSVEIHKGHRRNTSADSRALFKLVTDSGNLLPNSREPSHYSDESEEELFENGREFIELKDLADDHVCSAEGCKRIVINVSGLKFETQLRTLDRLPHTLLGDPEKRREYWDSKKKEYFFDRHRPSFSAILYYYQSGGRLRRPIEVPHDIFLNELQFFELGKHIINGYLQSEGFLVEKEVFLPEKPWMRTIWQLFEDPTSSFWAKVLAVISVIFIVTSVVTFCIETLPEFHGSNCVNASGPVNSSNQETKLVLNTLNPLFIIESVCIAFFLVELILRTICCPSKIRFVKSMINWIDLAAIMPYIVFLAMYLISGDCSDSQKGGFVSVLRVLRVTRILKLSKHSEGLKILGKTLQVSMKELTMFLTFLGIAIVIFSGAVFYAELPSGSTQYKSIPDAFWWAVVSMTTVGYGDVYPVTVPGKIIGSFTVICGILAIALPVPIVVTNFNNFYRASTGRGKE